MKTNWPLIIIAIIVGVFLLNHFGKLGLSFSIIGDQSMTFAGTTWNNFGWTDGTPGCGDYCQQGGDITMQVGNDGFLYSSAYSSGGYWRNARGISISTKSFEGVDDIIIIYSFNAGGGGDYDGSASSRIGFTGQTSAPDGTLYEWADIYYNGCNWQNHQCSS
jgi:hypothetical protein